MAFAAGEGNSLEAIGAYMAAHNPDVHYLLTGCSERGTDHVVICRNGKLVHDPGARGRGPGRTGFKRVVVGGDRVARPGDLTTDEGLF